LPELLSGSRLVLALSAAGWRLVTVADPLAQFELTDDQNQAATEIERDVLMTAGAGTGKTRTLVARYIYLLSTGLTERQIAAITFTEKAAREMRNRIRLAVSEFAAASAGEDRSKWPTAWQPRSYVRIQQKLSSILAFR
jgi:ATP-dependent exoDNAse (exonuclease V) beta subunit